MEGAYQRCVQWPHPTKRAAMGCPLMETQTFGSSKVLALRHNLSPRGDGNGAPCKNRSRKSKMDFRWIFYEISCVTGGSVVY